MRGKAADIWCEDSNSEGGEYIRIRERWCVCVHMCVCVCVTLSHICTTHYLQVFEEYWSLSIQ